MARDRVGTSPDRIERGILQTERILLVEVATALVTISGAR
jgi:hypothetical protein